MAQIEMPSFDSSKCSWKIYTQIFKNKMKIHDIEEEQWPLYLISFVGFDIVTLLTELCFPEDLEEKSFDTLIKLVEDHLAPEPSEVAETYRFMKRVQEPGESVMEYVGSLKKLAKTCNFGGYLSRALRDKFVHGLQNGSVVKKLLTIKDLSFAEAVKLASMDEIAEKDSKMVAGTLEKEVATISNVSNAKTFLTCHCCGKKGHIKPECFYKDIECKNCKKKGHMAALCRFKKEEKNAKTWRKAPVKTKRVHEVEVSDSEEEYTVMKVERQEEGNEDYFLPGLFTEKCVNKITELKEERPHPWMTKLNVDGVNVDFEIDCGADVTLMPERYVRKYFPKLELDGTNLKLKAYGDKPIDVIGKSIVYVKSKGKHYLAPLIIVKEGKRPLLGRDWLNVIKIDWPMCNKKSSCRKKSVRTVESDNETQRKLEKLLNRYPDIFSDDPGEIKGPPGKLKLKDNSVTPINCKPRRIAYAVENLVKKEIDSLVEKGKMVKVSKEEVTWGTPIVPIIKGPDNVRICGDYKVTINPNLEVPHHPLPVIEDIFAKLNSNADMPITVFSKIDLRRAYMNRRMDDEAQQLMTLSTPWGYYRPTFMMFGIAPAPLDWQEFMDENFSNVPNVYSYLDDILIANADTKSHLKTLEIVLNKLQHLNIKINKDKSKFVSNKLEYCGHIIDKKGIHKTPEHVKAILDAPQPKNVKQLKSFLGTVNFYNKFMPNAAQNLHALYKLLKKNVSWIWKSEHVKAFEWAKSCIASEQVLTHYDPKLPLVLSCDASKYGLGACLAHRIYDKNDNSKYVERPIAFASRTMTETEIRYSQIDKEALSIIWAVKKFDLYLKGNTFILITDHKPLISLFNPAKSMGTIYADRMSRWALILCNYSYTIQYRTSNNNACADFPSRLPIQLSKHDAVDSEQNQPFVNNIMMEIPPITHDVIAKATQNDRILSQVYNYIEHGWPRKISSDLLQYKGKELELYTVKGVITWRGRTIIPQKLRSQLLNELHTGHLGSLKMKNLAKSYFWWPGIYSEIESITANCEGCLQVRNKPEIKPLHSWEWPAKPWQRVHADFAGPFLGHMWLIVVDAHSKWPEIARMNKTTTGLTVKCLRSIFARFGLPEQLVTDNGPQWTSEEFKEFCLNNNIRHICTAPYHPASNGQAEWTVQTFKKALLASKFDNDDSDHKLLSWLLSYRTAPHSSTGKSPSELMFGRALRTRLSLVKNSVLIPKQSVPEKKVKSYLPGDGVRISMYDGKEKWMEGRIIEPIGNVMYSIDTHRGNVTRNVTQMLPIRKSPTICNTDGKQSYVEKNYENNSNSDDKASDVTCNVSSSVDDLSGTRSSTDVQIQSPSVIVRRSNRIPKPRQILDL